MRAYLASWLALSMILCLGGCRDDSKKDPDGPIMRYEAGVGDGAGPSTTINDITSGKIAEGATVTLREVVVSAVDGYGTYSGEVYVQELGGGPGSGIKLYRPERTDGAAIAELKPGDRVRVEGVVKWFTPSTPFKDTKHPDKKHIKELDTGCKITRLTAGDPPVPAVVTVADLTTDPTAEGWEHVLIQVKDVAVTKPLEVKYGEFQVGDGLPVDDELYPHTPKMGDCLTLTGIMIYFYGYKLIPRDGNDIGTGSGCAVPQVLTIKDVQDESSAKHPATGSVVTVNGVVSALDSTLGSGTSPKYTGGFWLQEEGAGSPRSGIYIYHTWDDSSSADKKPTMGAILELTGKYEEYKVASSSNPETLSELSGVFWVSKGQSSNPPQPVLIDPAEIATGGSKTEDYEGMLVKVENVEVESYVQTTGSTPKDIGFKLKTSGLMVENALFDFMATPPPLQTQYTSITGVLHYSYDNFKILPRAADDLIKP